MMVVHCSKIKIQRDQEARGTARRTWEGRRKGEVECVEDKLLGFSDSGGAACEGVFLVLSYTLHCMSRKWLLLPQESTIYYVVVFL